MDNKLVEALRWISGACDVDSDTCKGCGRPTGVLAIKSHADRALAAHDARKGGGLSDAAVDRLANHMATHFHIHSSRECWRLALEAAWGGFSDGWWCPKCGAEVSGETVTYDELHEVCGTPVTSALKAAGCGVDVEAVRTVAKFLRANIDTMTPIAISRMADKLARAIGDDHD